MKHASDLETAIPLMEDSSEVPALSIDEVIGQGDRHTSERQSVPTTFAPAVVIGKLLEIESDGTPLVDFQGNRFQRPIAARTTAHLDASALGSEVALLFEQGDLSKPIIMGCVCCLPDKAEANSKASTAQTVIAGALKIEATADGERIVVSAEQEIEFRCGKASITLTRAGKVLIRGEYVLSRSSGVNRIKGGSVQIN